MNRFERRPIDAGEAKIEFVDGEYRIIRPGAFVRCAVTGEAIRVRLRASVSCMKTAITNNVFAIETPKFNMLFNTPSLSSELPALSASRASNAASTRR